jgi:hypothetical protein
MQNDHLEVTVTYKVRHAYQDRVARFVLVKDTQTGKIDHITTTYQPNGRKIYQ